MRLGKFVVCSAWWRYTLYRVPSCWNMSQSDLSYLSLFNFATNFHKIYFILASLDLTLVDNELSLHSLHNMCWEIACCRIQTLSFVFCHNVMPQSNALMNSCLCLDNSVEDYVGCNVNEQCELSINSVRISYFLMTSPFIKQIYCLILVTACHINCTPSNFSKHFSIKCSIL